MTEAIVKNESAIVAFGLKGKDAVAAIQQNTGNGGLGFSDLDRIKVPAGGGTSFAVPGLSGEKDEKEIEGVVIGWNDTRSYWESEFEGASQPPDCSSIDGLVGVGNPGGRCSACPMSQFGSAEKGDGQACKNMRVMFVLGTDGLLPLVLTAPPTSLRNMKKFFLRLASAGKSYNHVVTKFHLEKTKSGGGISYSQVHASMVRELTPDEIQASDDYSRKISPSMKRVVNEEVQGEAA